MVPINEAILFAREIPKKSPRSFRILVSLSFGFVGIFGLYLALSEPRNRFSPEVNRAHQRVELTREVLASADSALGAINPSAEARSRVAKVGPLRPDRPQILASAQQIYRELFEASLLVRTAASTLNSAAVAADGPQASISGRLATSSVRLSAVAVAVESEVEQVRQAVAAAAVAVPGPPGARPDSVFSAALLRIQEGVSRTNGIVRMADSSINEKLKPIAAPVSAPWRLAWLVAVAVAAALVVSAIVGIGKVAAEVFSVDASPDAKLGEKLSGLLGGNVALPLMLVLGTAAALSLPEARASGFGAGGGQRTDVWPITTLAQPGSDTAIAGAILALTARMGEALRGTQGAFQEASSRISGPLGQIQRDLARLGNETTFVQLGNEVHQIEVRLRGTEERQDSILIRLAAAIESDSRATVELGENIEGFDRLARSVYEHGRLIRFLLCAPRDSSLLAAIHDSLTGVRFGVAPPEPSRDGCPNGPTVPEHGPTQASRR